MNEKQKQVVADENTGWTMDDIGLTYMERTIIWSIMNEYTLECTLDDMYMIRSAYDRRIAGDAALKNFDVSHAMLFFPETSHFSANIWSNIILLLHSKSRQMDRYADACSDLVDLGSRILEQKEKYGLIERKIRTFLEVHSNV